MGRGISKAGGGSSGGAGGNTKAEQDIYAIKTTAKAMKQELSNAPVGTTVAYNFDAGHSIVYEKLDFQDSLYNNYWAVTTISKNGSLSYRRLSEAQVSKDVLDWNKSKTISKGLNAERKKKYKNNQRGIIGELGK